MAKKINKTPEQIVSSESYVERFAREHKIGKYRVTEATETAEQTLDVEGDGNE